MLTETKQDGYFRLFLVFAASTFAYFLVFQLPFTPLFIEWDQLIFAYEGVRLLHGDVIYRDFFEFTTPGASVFYSALFSIFGEKYYLLSLTIVALAIVTTLLTFEISRRTVVGPLRFLPPLIWLFFGFKWMGLDGSHRMFSPIFVLLAMLTMMKGRTRSHLIVSGAFLGLASAFTQQRGLVAAFGIAAFLFIESYLKDHAIKRAFVDSVWMFLAFFITFALLMAPFIWSAGINDFLYATLIYPLFYYSSAPANGYGVFISDVVSGLSTPGVSVKLAQAVAIFYVWLLPIILVIAIFVIRPKVVRRMSDEYRAPLLCITISLFTFVTTVGPNAIRFFQISVPVIVLLCWLAELSPAIKKIEFKLAATLAILLIVLVVSQAVRIQASWEFQHVDTPTGTLAFIVPEQADFYADLASQTTAGETVFESVQPHIYFPLRLRNPTKMAQVWPYDYTRPEQVANVIDDLEHSRPRLIVWDNLNNRSDVERSPGDHLGPLADFVNSQYVPTGRSYLIEGHPLQIYQLKTAN